MWDLSTALDLCSKGEEESIDTGGPNPYELMEQLDLCDLTNSCTTTPSISPSPSLLNSIYPFSPRGTTPPAVSTPERLRRAGIEPTLGTAAATGTGGVKPKVTQF